LRILVVEDDQELAGYLVKGLGEGGHKADHAPDGPTALVLATQQGYDVLIVDRMLPGLEGLSVIGALRKNGILTPALILSAKGQVADRIEGLRAGADDYLPKPFAFAELLARVEALARRTRPAAEPTTLRVADLEVDLLARRVTRGGHAIELQPREYRVLETLMRHAGHVVTRTMLLESVWDYNFDPQTNVIDVHISRLRQKIDRGFSVPLLHTVRGAGYRLSEDG
jgi:two-component system OmpR family response regulator